MAKPRQTTPVAELMGTPATQTTLMGAHVVRRVDIAVGETLPKPEGMTTDETQEIPMPTAAPVANLPLAPARRRLEAPSLDWAILQTL